MPAPVWVLSVDLQTKTATFQSGLADAAKAARGAFSDIGGGAGNMGRGVGYSMTEARHSVMLLTEEFGGHMPRAIATLIAGLGPLGPALDAAFPFIGIVVGVTLLLEHLAKLREEGEALTQDQVKFGVAVANAYDQLDRKILQAQIKADNLKNDHLSALRHELELIDKQSMDDLVKSFEEVAKAADIVMKDLEGHWYNWGQGSDGAEHALADFQNQYDLLLKQGKEEQASGFLGGTLKQAREVLTALQHSPDLRSGHQENTDESHAAEIEAQKTLERYHVKIGLDLRDQIAAQQQLVDALQTQVNIEQQSAALKHQEGSNAAGTTGNEMAAQRSAAAREAADSQLRMGESMVAADKATAEAQLTISRATIQQRLASDLDFAQRELDVKQAANEAQIAALDKSGKDYQNQLKALQDKALELTVQNDAQVAQLKSRAAIEENAKELQTLEQGERQKIEATERGSQARVAAIDAAIEEEKQKNLEDTDFFRELLTMRVEAVRQEADEEGRLREEAGREDATHQQVMAELSIAAQRQQFAVLDSARRADINRRMAEEITLADATFKAKMDGYNREIQSLDKHAKDYQNKLKAIQDKETQLTRQHEEEITAIKDKAETERNQRILSAEDRFEDSISSGLTKTLMGQQSWAKMMVSLGDQVVSGMMQAAIKSLIMDDFTKERDAAHAARKAFMWAWDNTGPAAPFIAPVMGAAAFAAVMAFQGGTDRVPGVGRGDSVPAMLTPGEGVVPGGVMDGLRKMANGGGFGAGPTYHVHVQPVYNLSAMDAAGLESVLENHSGTLERHVSNTIRKLNN